MDEVADLIKQGLAVDAASIAIDPADINATKTSVEAEIKKKITDKISEVFTQFALIPEAGTATHTLAVGGVAGFVDFTDYKIGTFTYVPAGQIAGAGVGEVAAAYVAQRINDSLELNGLWGLARDNKDKFKPTEDSKDIFATWSEEKSEVKSHNQQGSFGFRFGYGHSFDKFHAGIELFGEGNCGKTTVKQSVGGLKKTTFEKNGTGFKYGGEMPVVDQRITLKNN